MFTIIYDFFKNKKPLLVLILLGILALAAFLILKLRFEEDISKIMPVDKKVAELNKLLENSAFTDRLVLNITFADSTLNPENPDELIAYCDALVDTLQKTVDSTIIRQIIHKIDDSQFLNLYDIIYNNLPLFLEAEDYQKIAEITDTARIAEHLQGAYRTLMTPGSGVLKQFVLRDPLSLSRLAFEQLQSFQIDENYTIHQGYVVTKDFQNLLIFISPAQPARETMINKQLVKALDETIAAIDDRFDHQVQATYFGGVAVAVDNATRIRIDVTATVTVAMLFLFILISFFFRRPSVFFLMVLPVIFGAASALAMLYLFKGTVSIIAIGVGSVLVGITLDYSLHIFTHHRSTGNVYQVIKDLAVPILMSSLTTTAAFLCLYWIRSEALHDLGLFAALSVLAAAVFALIILPIFLSKKEDESKPAHQVTFLDKIADYPLHKNRLVLAFIGVVSIICLFTASDIQFEKDLNKVNYMSKKVKAAEDRLNSITSATMRGVYLVASGTTLEEALRHNEQILPIADSLKAAGIIKEYTTPSKLILTPELQEEKIATWNAYWTSEKKQQLKGAIAKSAADLKFKPDAFTPFSNLLDKEFAPQEVTAFSPLIDLFLKDFISERPDFVTILTLLRLDQSAKPDVYATFQNRANINILDKEFLISKFIDILRHDFDGLVKISLLLVFLILHLAYGRLELAFIAFVPILLSWLWTLGLMNIFGLKFNIINIIITTFVFGLGIDYSIFIMRGLLQEYKYGERNLTSYKTSILLSALTTLTGIGVLIFAQHPALKSIAGLSIIGISSVILICFAVEPLLFRWLIYNKKGERREYPRTIANTYRTLHAVMLIAIGSIIVSVLGGLLYIFFFISMEKRKYLLHWMICQLSRFYIWVSFFPNKKVINELGEDFSKPAVIISNHQSHIDTPIMFTFHPKLIILTKGWVYKFPLYHFVCRFADYFTVSNGLEAILPGLKERAAQNYHISVFPEGSRSRTDKVNRFHKGAFVIAEKLQLDILPVYLHGTGRFLRKEVFWGQNSDLTIKIGERIKPGDPRFGTDDTERTKNICRFYRAQYDAFKEQCDTPRYYRRHLMENYTYKGPILEWYSRIKIRMEDYYRLFDELIPKKATITDIGCGYGYMSYLLAFRSAERKILGIDYDTNKIKTAQNGSSRPEQLQFVSADIIAYPLPPSDVFILADIMHYLPEEEQQIVFEKCAKQLNDNGMIIIRDGDSDLQQRHKGTKLTEIFSTNLGFNKTRNKLRFFSGKELEKWAQKHHLTTKRIDITKRTSNIIYVLEKLGKS